MKDILMQDELENSLINDLPVPPVKTTIVYASYLQTRSAYYINRHKQLKTYERSNIYWSGGDGVANTYSSILPGLKWIYDAKLDKTKNNKINFVEYCSLLHDADDFKWNKQSKEEKEFTSIGCACLSHDNEYILSNINTDNDRCSHGTIITDDSIIYYVLNLCSKKIYFQKL